MKHVYYTIGAEVENQLLYLNFGPRQLTTYLGHEPYKSLLYPTKASALNVLDSIKSSSCLRPTSGLRFDINASANCSFELDDLKLITVTYEICND